MARAGHWGIAAALTLAVAATKPAASQEFYAGKTLTLLAGAPAGAEQDKLARLVAKHLGAHIPGKPVITVDNRSANGGLDALNAFFNDAPKDGTALHLVMPGMTLLQALRAPQVHYNTAALGYIGNLSKSPHVLATWWVTGFKTIDDGRRREMVLGAVGNASPGALYPDIVTACCARDSRSMEATGGTQMSMKPWKTPRSAAAWSHGARLWRTSRAGSRKSGWDFCFRPVSRAIPPCPRRHC
jgi:hypothetical protein